MRKKNANISRFSSTVLRAQFLRRFRTETCIGANDALNILNPSFGDRLIDGFYIFGNYPWSTPNTPTTLFSFPEDQSSFKTLAKLCFPDGNNFTKKKCSLISSVYDSSQIDNSQFYILYIPEDIEPSYLYCLRFSCNPLTIPSLCHSLTIFQLFEYVNEQSMPYCDVSIAIKSKIPNYSTFLDFMKWILKSEMTARLQISEEIDNFQSASLISNTMVWPEKHHQKFFDSITPFLTTTLPENENETISIDVPPYPRFQCVIDCSENELETMCMTCLFSKLSIRNFWTLFSCLLLEKSIVIFHPDKNVVCNSVIALHLLIKPFIWTFCSLSLLPSSLYELLSMPTPMIAGTIASIDNIESNFIFVNLERDEVTLREEVILHPKDSQFYKEFTKSFSELKNRNPNPAVAMTIFERCKSYVKQMLDVITSSIISDFSIAEQIHSQFFVELYLQHFQAPERDFMQQFSSTQMAMLQIEQLCRKRSDEMTAIATTNT